MVVGDYCVITPNAADGKPSKLYEELLNKLKSRPLVNLIYVSYLQSGVASAMDSAGYRKNKQGEHSAKDVISFFGVENMQIEAGKPMEIGVQIGARTATGDFIDFTSAEEALQKASQANSKFKGTISYVVRKGDVFNILTEGRDAKTQLRAYEVNVALKVWDLAKQVFKTKGIDITTFSFYRELINAQRGTEFINWLYNSINAKNEILSEKEMRTFLEFGKDTTQVKRLVTMFGSLDKAASAVYDGYRQRKQNYTQAQLDLMDNALTEGRKVGGLDIQNLKDQVDTLASTLASSSEEVSIQQTLDDLNSKYHINAEEHVSDTSSVITTMSEAASQALFILNRKLQDTLDREGVTPESKNLEQLAKGLAREIKNKKFHKSILNFLQIVENEIPLLESLLQNSFTDSGTGIERCKTRASALLEIIKTINEYSPLIETLLHIDELLTDESIDDANKKAIQNIAVKINDFLIRYKNKTKGLSREVMLDIMVECMGQDAAHAFSIAEIIKMAEDDNTFIDLFYSMARTSNPLTAVMGGIIRDKQAERTERINEIALKIRRATDKLYKAGFTDTSFMYDLDREGNINGYIAGDIDWETWEEEKNKYRQSLINSGVRGLELKEAMDIFYETHTEEVVVDKKSGRTERVPIYNKTPPTFTPEQQEYYNTVMQIKGELGTLLPYYAQFHFRAPQIRSSRVDQLIKSKGNVKDIAKIVLESIKDTYTIREDDPLNPNNGIIEGESFVFSRSDRGGVPLKRIPIFYVNMLRDKGELLTDFSGALQSFAGTVINYDCMYQIKDIVEFMGDFIKKQAELAKNNKDENQAEQLEVEGLKLVNKLQSVTRSFSTSSIIDGFMDQHFYGVKLKKIGPFTKVMLSLLKYTSLRALTVNVKGMIANSFNGNIQLMIEAMAGEFFSVSDFLWAKTLLFGDNTIGAPGKIMDFLSNNVNNKIALLAQKFDPLTEEFHQQSHTRYFSTRSIGGILRHLISVDLSFIGYGAGEKLLGYTTMLSVLHNTKVKIDGKDSHLFDAFTTKGRDDGNSELVLKQNVTREDENGNWVPVDEAFLKEVERRIRYVNQSTQGSMNEEDKGIINQYLAGKFVMNLRQWMVEHYSRRYRKGHWDATLKQYREGFQNSTAKFLLHWADDIFNLEHEAALHWDEMDEGQKRNVYRALAEQFTLACLLGLSFALGEPEDHKRRFWMRMFIYQTKRALMETRAGIPYGLPMELTSIINSPVSATNTVNTIFYPFLNLDDLSEKVKTGRYRGWNRWVLNTSRDFVPFWGQVEQLRHMDEDPSVFAVFNKSGNM